MNSSRQLAPCRPEAGGEVRNGVLGEERRQAVERRIAEAAGESPACVALDRAPTTRSYSPSRAARRTASSGWCWPSPSMIRMYSPVAARMPVLTAAPLPLLYGMPDDAGAGRGRGRGRVVGRAVVDDEDLVPGAGRA